MNLEALFGGLTATQCLLYLARYEESGSTEISAAFKMAKSQAFTQLTRLEKNGIISRRQIGNVNVYSLNPRSGIKNELKAMLEKYIDEQMPRDRFPDFYLVRRRPRASGKVLGGVYAKKV